MAREGLMDDAGYMGFEECAIYEECSKEAYEKGYADAINECTDKFADILSNMKQICGVNCPVNCNWGTSESCKSMIKKWLLEQLKEQK